MVYKIRLGVRFQPIGETETTEENLIVGRHWVLVAESDSMGEKQRRTIEFFDQGMEFRFFYEELESHPVATYYGDLEDIAEVLRHHPVRNNAYDACYNNCQHFVATLLILLQAYTVTRTNSSRGREFRIINKDRFDNIINVLESDSDNGTLTNRPNKIITAKKTAPISTAAAGWGVAVVAAEATVAVPASGIAGWFGATVAVPTLFASVAAVAAPVLLLGAIGAGGYYVTKNLSWAQSTRFDDPRVKGFPTGGRLAIDRSELAEFSGISGSASIGTSVRSIRATYDSLNAFKDGVDISSVILERFEAKGPKEIKR